jgi:uncharacterized protein (TIGR03437 family)
MLSRLVFIVLTAQLAAAAVVYSYDSGGRLIKADYGVAGAITYTYDAAGNLITRSVAPGMVVAPVITNVVNAEGGSTTIAPNTWMEIDGTNLAPSGDIRIWQNADFAGNHLPTQLDGVSVTINGKNAFVYYISPTQVNILTPPDAMPGSAQIQITSGGISSAVFNTHAQPLSPSFFVFNGGPYVAAVHADGSFIGPTSLYPGLTTPAKPGEFIALYANGFGPVEAQVFGGALTQSGQVAFLPLIKIGGIAAAVQFAGLVAPGEFQFNIAVPPNAPDGDNSLTVAYNNLGVQAGLLITVQH